MGADVRAVVGPLALCDALPPATGPRGVKKASAQVVADPLAGLRSHGSALSPANP